QPDGCIRLLRHGLPRGLEVERMAPLGGLAYGQEPFARRDDVYLLVEDPVLLADRDRDEEDAEDVVVVALEPRSRLVVVPRRPQKLLVGAVVDLAWQRVVECLLLRVEQVDPLGHRPSVLRRSASPRGARPTRWPRDPRARRASAPRRAPPSRRCRPRSLPGDTCGRRRRRLRKRPRRWSR